MHAHCFGHRIDGSLGNNANLCSRSVVDEYVERIVSPYTLLVPLPLHDVHRAPSGLIPTLRNRLVIGNAKCGFAYDWDTTNPGKLDNPHLNSGQSFAHRASHHPDLSAARSNPGRQLAPSFLR